jgi:short-subunit dehydrogenase
MQAQTALITGASAGIGRDLAHQFAADGYDLVLVARRAAALEELAAEVTRAHRVKATAIPADLAQPGGARQILDAVTRSGIVVDVVVNNAGIGMRGTVAQLPVERQLEIIQVNVTALTELTRLFLPGMLERNRGGVLNVGSTAGFQPGPYMAVYYATKAYVVSFTEALAEEVVGTALRISCLAPGPTVTEFAKAADMTATRLFRGPTMSSSDVARIGYAGWKRGKLLVVAGLSNRLGVLLVRIAPRSMVRRLVKRLNT